jgi:inner membrane protein involved in colicin E2 resistance
MTDTTSEPMGPWKEVERAPAPPPAPPDLTSLSFYKIALIAGIAVATVLPNLFISNLIEERETRQEGVRQEFTRNWGPEQSLYSPTLVIPYQAGDANTSRSRRRDSTSSRRSVRRSASAACSTRRSTTPRWT